MRKAPLLLVSSLLVTGLLTFSLSRASELTGNQPGSSTPEARPPLPLPRPPSDEPRRSPERYILPPRYDLRVSLEVLVNGRPLPTIEYAGRTYLPVPRLGAEYEIRVWNHGPRRVEAVVSVDGLSVISGEPDSTDQRGYLVAPHSHIVIKGWRRNLDTVAAFSFQDRDNSYASRVGRSENIGVIRMMAVEEKVRPIRLPLAGKSAAPQARSASGSESVGSTGTGYGPTIDSRASYVSFVRGQRQRTITLYYDTVEALRRAGVPVGNLIPFPGDQEFVPPPPSSSSSGS